MSQNDCSEELMSAPIEIWISHIAVFHVKIMV